MIVTPGQPFCGLFCGLRIIQVGCWTTTVTGLQSLSHRLPISAEWHSSLRQSRRGRDRQNKPVWAEHLATVSLADIPRCSPIRPLSGSVLRASETMLDSYPNTAPLVHQECARGQRSKVQQNPWAAPAPRSQIPVRFGYRFPAAIVRLQRPPADKRLKWATA